MFIGLGRYFRMAIALCLSCSPSGRNDLLGPGFAPEDIFKFPLNRFHLSRISVVERSIVMLKSHFAQPWVGLLILVGPPS
jgi:hypothetical protein